MPAFRGHFSVQGSAVGGLSYKEIKNAPCHILAPRRGCFGHHLPLRQVCILAKRSYMIGHNFLSYKKQAVPSGIRPVCL